MKTTAELIEIFVNEITSSSFTARAVQSRLDEIAETARREEHDRWANQKCNEHDEKIRKLERERILGKLPKMRDPENSLLYKEPASDLHRAVCVANYCGFNQCLFLNLYSLTPNNYGDPLTKS